MSARARTASDLGERAKNFLPPTPSIFCPRANGFSSLVLGFKMGSRICKYRPPNRKLQILEVGKEVCSPRLLARRAGLVVPNPKFAISYLVGTRGFEPLTLSTSKRCSTTELSAQIVKRALLPMLLLVHQFSWLSPSPAPQAPKSHSQKR